MKMIWLTAEGTLRQTLKNLTTQLTPLIHSEKNSEFFLNLCFKIKLLSAATLFALAMTLFASAGLGMGPISLHKKSIPAITYKNISPPYKDYEYFQNREIVPFEYRASSFSLVNAWWLAEASTLVYADEAYVRPRFREAGLNRVVFFNRSGTQCFIASNSRFAIVAFRGSEIWNKDQGFDLGQMIADFMTDIDIRLSDWVRGGKVHTGFKAALDSVWDDMLPEIKRLRDQDVLIWVTGHSLGAALATLAADRLPNVQGLYTFGSPRVGDEEFQKRFEPKAFRVVNGKDIVTDVPSKDPYRHVGEYIFIDQKGRIHTRPPVTEKSDDASCDTNSNTSGNAGEVQKSDSALYIPDWIRDHVPVLYSIYLWNKVVESLTGCEIPKMTQTAAATTEPAASEPEANASPGTPVDLDNPLSGTEWRLVEFQSMNDTIGTVKPEDPSLFTMRLNSDGTVDMRLDCNSASGTWISEPGDDGSSGRFEFGALAATRAMCPPPNLDEHILTQARYIRGYLLRGGKLYLSLMADGGIYAWESVNR
jgi:triacylglycerol lipase